MGVFIHLVLSVLKIQYNYCIPIQIDLHKSITASYIMNVCSIVEWKIAPIVINQ